ncbi:hypothetical protein [Planomicrobium sp. CPCC 101110]|uniref:DUF6115 domain-containing protein n=1 Tax=Planomicrobium sp. CPCC 101110 TaxID=2599619 RepID=UPI002106D7F6|nr:hypothetical protein [Planomicrobium sp. CPCC 101110]
MEWLLVTVLLILAIFINVKSFLGISEIRQQRQQMIEESEAISQSMEEFVDRLEKENDELYQKLVDYIKVKESDIDEKIRGLEEKLGGVSVAAPVFESLHVQKEDEGNDPSMQEQEKISQLYKQGFSVMQIAKVLKLEQGKVELAVNLFNRKKSYQN